MKRSAPRLLLLALILALAAPAFGRAPNIVFFLIDDWGWTDAACYGSKLYETPNIDRLATQGMKFSDAYAACTVCSPTRAATMTGKYPARLHITDWIAGHVRPNAKLKIPDWTKYLPLEETTIAEALRARGYATGLFGKWHLGGPEFFRSTRDSMLTSAAVTAANPARIFRPTGS
jgi:arylsulfatase A-like enzyme